MEWDEVAMEAVSFEQGADWAAVAPLIQARQQEMAARSGGADRGAVQMSALGERLKLERLQKEQQLSGLRSVEARYDVRTAEAAQGEAKPASPAPERADVRPTEAEQEQIKALEARDREVRRHEQAHAAVGGQFAGPPTYTYQIGPDGRRYAVGGAVSIDVSPVPGDPAATIEKMEVVKAAALAPASPSAADRQVAALATAQRVQAMAELMAVRGQDRMSLMMPAGERATVDKRA
ncbi:MAG: putative metalloprotease CJM1_0395 family protein [Pseudomonadota bacterium]